MGRVKEQLLEREVEDILMDELHQEMVESGDYTTIFNPIPTEEDLNNMFNEQSVSNIFSDIDSPVEYVDITLVTGETATIRKSDYEFLQEFGELY